MFDATLLHNHVRFETSCSGGPGGQHVNRTRSRVTACLLLEGCPLFTPEQITRIRAKLAGRINQEGVLRVSAENSRAQEENREQALLVMTDLLRNALVRPKRRVPTRKTGASQQRRIEEKKKRSGIKQGRKGADHHGC